VQPMNPQQLKTLTASATRGAASSQYKLGLQHLTGGGLHSSSPQLNLSRVCHKKTPYTP